MTRRKPHSFSTTPEMWEEIAGAANVSGQSQSAVINEALSQFFATKIKRSSWETGDEDSWYDERKFYTFSEDKKGHSIQVRMWVPKNLAGQIARIVGSGEVPELRGPQDFYRDALLHRAHKIAQWLDDGELHREVGMAILQAEEDAIAQAKVDFEALINSTRENLEEAWRRDDLVWLDEHIKTRYDLAPSIPEAFRGKYVELLDSYQNRLREVTKRGLRSVEGGRGIKGEKRRGVREA